MAAITLGIFAAWFHAPLSGDNKIFFAAARQADNQGNFPLNVYRSWELKPLGHRAIIYGVYKIATVFSDFPAKVAFERAVKAVYGAIVFLATLGFVFSIRRFLQGINLSPRLVFLAILLIFFSMSFLIRLQPEEISLIFIMAAVPLALSNSRRLNLLAGLPLAALFTLKGITILLGIHVLLMVYVLGPDFRKNLVWSAAGAAGWLAVILGVLLTVFPQELRDMRNATLFQGSLEIELKRFGSLPWAFWHKFQFAPVLAPAVIFGWLSFPLLIYYRRWMDTFVIISVGAVSGAVVLIQGLFFGYHYAAFVAPAVWILVMILHRTGTLTGPMTGRQLAFLAGWSLGLVGFLAVATYVDRRTTDVVPLSVIGYNLAALLAAFLIALGWLLIRLKHSAGLPSDRLVMAGLAVVFAVAFWARYESPWNLYLSHGGTTAAERRVFGELEERYHLSDQEELLYLSGDGAYAYYFGAPTHCRYFTLEAIKRVHSEVGAKGLLDSPVFRETMNCILSYQGEFILMAPVWPALQSFTEVTEKIEKGYELVAESNSSPEIAIYKRARSPGQ